MKKMNICKCNLKNLENNVTPNIIIKMYTKIYMNYEIDVDYGAKCEKIVIIKLQNHFNNKLTKLDYYDNFDFIDEKQEIYIELKSRRCKIDTYKTTMIGMNKLNMSKILHRKKNNIYFCFYFTDIDYSTTELYYWKYNIDELDQLIYKNRGRVDRGKRDIKKYAYIPVDLLIKI